MLVCSVLVASVDVERQKGASRSALALCPWSSRGQIKLRLLASNHNLLFMYKNALITAASVAMVLGFGVSAFAATISNPLFSNSDTTIDAQGNSTVSGTFTLQVASNEVCEVLRTQADPSRP